MRSAAINGTPCGTNHTYQGGQCVFTCDPGQFPIANVCYSPGESCGSMLVVDGSGNCVAISSPTGGGAVAPATGGDTTTTSTASTSSLSGGEIAALAGIGGVVVVAGVLLFRSLRS
jgi:hypothetical protein